MGRREWTPPFWRCNPPNAGKVSPYHVPAGPHPTIRYHVLSYVDVMGGDPKDKPIYIYIYIYIELE